MTDLEISKRLALAIGWKPEQMGVFLDCLFIQRPKYMSRHFDYRDWDVAGPIAERFKCYPDWQGHFKWCSRIDFTRSWGDTPQQAIALAVIGSVK